MAIEKNDFVMVNSRQMINEMSSFLCNLFNKSFFFESVGIFLFKRKNQQTHKQMKKKHKKWQRPHECISIKRDKLMENHQTAATSGVHQSVGCMSSHGRVWRERERGSFIAVTYNNKWNKN